MKKILRLTEGDLHRIIKNSVKRIIRESDEYYDTSSDDFYSEEDNYGNQGEEGMVKSGGLATYGINYYELGKQTAKQAVAILRDGANPAEMPIEYLEKCDLAVNHETEAAIGVKVPVEM